MNLRVVNECVQLSSAYDHCQLSHLRRSMNLAYRDIFAISLSSNHVEYRQRLIHQKYYTVFVKHGRSFDPNVKFVVPMR
jgi:hypothetical protein